MPKQTYRCENAGSMCRFALDPKRLVEFEPGAEPPCGIKNCGPGVDWLKPTSGRAFPLVPLLAGTAAVLLLAGGGAAWYFSQGGPEAAQEMIDEFYPELPRAEAAQ